MFRGVKGSSNLISLLRARNIVFDRPNKAIKPLFLKRHL